MPDDTKRSYDAVADDYAERISDELDGKPLDRALLDALIELADGGGVADIGCGPGHVARYLRRKNTKTIALDLSPAMAAIANRHTPAAAADMTALPIKDKRLAAIISLYAVIHLDEHQRAAAYREFARTLQPGGTALIAFHTSDAEIPIGGAKTFTQWWGHDVALTVQVPRPGTRDRQTEPRRAHPHRTPGEAVGRRRTSEPAQLPRRPAAVAGRLSRFTIRRSHLVEQFGQQLPFTVVQPHEQPLPRLDTSSRHLALQVLPLGGQTHQDGPAVVRVNGPLHQAGLLQRVNQTGRGSRDDAHPGRQLAHPPRAVAARDQTQHPLLGRGQPQGRQRLHRRPTEPVRGSHQPFDQLGVAHAHRNLLARRAREQIRPA